MVVPFVLLALGRVCAALPLVVVAGVVQMVGFPWLYRTGWADLAGLTGEGPGNLPVYLRPGTATVLVAWTLLLLVFVLGYLGIIAYAVVDARPAVAVTVLLSVPVVDLVGSMLTWGVGLSVSTVTILLVLVLPVGVAGWIGARRQARRPAPDAHA